MLSDKMDQMIRVGFVNARMPEKMRVKVTIPDTTTSPLITDWLPVLCPRASQDMQYDLPDVGDQVLCLFLPYGLEQGFVVGAMYGKQQPPVQSGDKWHRKFSDGATLEYDRKSHSLMADIPGTAKIKCKESITLEAPIIYLRGTLANTAMDGSPGESVFSGGMTVQNGGVNVPDADVSASGVSLTDHSHEGVQGGNDTSSHPVGGGTGKGTETQGGSGDGGNSGGGNTIADAAKMAAHLALLQKKVDADKSENGDINRLIMCLPKIANAMAEQTTNEADKQGWIYLHDMFEEWLAGVADEYGESALQKDTANKPFIVSWDWLLNFDRAKESYTTITNKNRLFSPNAKELLVKRLAKAGKFTDKVEKFDFISSNWRAWPETYFQSEVVPAQNFLSLICFGPDGLHTAMAAFMFYALANGHVKPIAGGYRIEVEEVAIVAFDRFNFMGEQDYRYWKCSPPDFSRIFSFGSHKLTNEHFRKFRSKFGKGANFPVISHPRQVDIGDGFFYDYLK